MEVPAPVILHMETPSPFTPLGAKGVGEGNCMSTPVCIANAVADALGVAQLDLPLTPAKIAAHLHGAENEARSPDGAKRNPGTAARLDSDERGYRAVSGVPDLSLIHI